MSTAKYGVDSPLKTPTIDFAIVTPVGNTNDNAFTLSTDPVAYQSDFTVTNPTLNNTGPLYFDYKVGDTSLTYSGYTMKFTDLVLNMFTLPESDFQTYMTNACDGIKAYLSQ